MKSKSQKRRIAIQKAGKKVEVVISVCYGGFGLSDEAFELYLNKKGQKYYKVKDEKFSFGGEHYYAVPKEQYDELNKKCQAKGNYKEINDKNWFLSDRDIKRDDPLLVEVVKELGEKANGRFAKLKVVSVPADVEWDIDEYDGTEWVAECHRRWS
jgi:hypothetical protein